MMRFYIILFIGLSIIGCKEKSDKTDSPKNKVEFNQDLANELAKMVDLDQLAALNAYPPIDYKLFSIEQWRSFKDSIYKTHQKRLNEIFERYGYPGFDLVGKNGSRDFWLMTQHSDFDPEFQNKILKQLEIEVKNKNADGRNFGLLTDRVRLNTGRKQVYGTQVDYNWQTCQAFPKNLADSINVNKRRIEVGLEPLEEYLNRMSEMHFEMNKELFLDKGIKKPKLYKTENSQ